MPSIQARLASGLLISLALLLIGQWLVVERSIDNLSQQYIASRMLHSSDLLVAAVTLNGNDVVFAENRIDPVYHKPFSGFYYALKVAGKEYRSRSLWDESLPIADLTAGVSHTSQHVGPQQQQLLVLNSAYKKKNLTLQITVAEDISGINRDISLMLKSHAIFSLAILLVLMLLQVMIIRKALNPLEKARQQLVDLENGLIQKLDEKVPREIFALVHEINLRITAYQQRLERSRRATGNLAHALKRPLTLLSQMAEGNESVDEHTLLENVKHYSQEIQYTIDRELTRARMAGTSMGAKQIDARIETESLIKLLQSMYSSKALNFDFSAKQDCPAKIEREDFHELMGNILDNACKWAQHTVNVTIDCTQGLRLQVEDDGPGIPDAQQKQILLRGSRLDEQVTGHGLGLSIVKDIVDQYQGNISLDVSPTLGGLKFTVRF